MSQFASAGKARPMGGNGIRAWPAKEIAASRPRSGWRSSLRGLPGRRNLGSGVITGACSHNRLAGSIHCHSDLPVAAVELLQARFIGNRILAANVFRDLYRELLNGVFLFWIKRQ